MKTIDVKYLTDEEKEAFSRLEKAAKAKQQAEEKEAAEQKRVDDIVRKSLRRIAIASQKTKVGKIQAAIIGQVIVDYLANDLHYHLDEATTDAVIEVCKTAIAEYTQNRQR